MHVSIASFIPCIYWCLVYFCYECLFVTSTDMFKNELITWMYCWLVFCCHFFQLSTLAIACLFAFVTPAGVFLERAIHAFIRFQLFHATAFLYVYYFGSRVFRTSHTCILPFHSQLFQLQFYIRLLFRQAVLNKSYGLTGPGTSLMRCSFTT